MTTAAASIVPPAPERLDAAAVMLLTAPAKPQSASWKV
jgi:hypothetical protein